MRIEDFNILKVRAEKEIQFKNDIDSAMEMSTRIPNLYMKYLDLYTAEFNELKKLNYKMEKKYGELLEDTKFNSTMVWKDKWELESQINRDQIYYDMKIEYAQKEYMVKYLEELLGNINRMGFSIKSFVDCKKMMYGLQ